MLAQKLYEELQSAEKKYLVLAKVFSKVFGRKLRKNEWGFLRKTINLYGADIVFWAMLNSMHIKSDGTPLKYVYKVACNMAKEEIEKEKKVSTNLRNMIQEARKFERPDWDTIIRKEKDASS
jgi:hypothetical protein